MRCLPSRNGTGRFVLLLITALLALVMPAAGGDAPAGEDRLDARLKLAARLRRQAELVSASGGTRGARTASRALLDRVQGRGEGAVTQAVGAEPRLSLLVRVQADCSALESLDFRVQAQVGRVCTGTLAADRLNLTRVFSGAYREVPGDFNIASNTLRPW